MGTLVQDIRTQSEWITKAFAEDKYKLDFTIHSFIEIDKFFNKHAKDGKAVKRGRLSKNLGLIIFSLGSYVGETIIKNIPESKWPTDDNDPEGEISASILLPDGTTVFPMQRIMKRFTNGMEDGIYPYGHTITEKFISEPFDQSFWNLSSQSEIIISKPWWKFW